MYAELAKLAKEIAYSFEAKKDALKQSQKGGIRVTFKINPEDMPPELYTDPMGQRYVVAIVPKNDDETPRLPKPEKPKSFAGQAKMMAKEEEFTQFMQRHENDLTPHCAVTNEDEIRRKCGVTSCSEIINGTEAGNQFKALQASYLNWKNTPSYDDIYR